MPGVYFVDTSALAKWYVNESRSEEVEEYLGSVRPAYISLLTKVEMRSLLGRRVREGHIDPLTQGKVLSTFRGDVAAGHLVLLPHTVESFLLAELLLGAHPEIPLRTIDAFHLGIMQAAGVTTLATADRVMAQAAEALGLTCKTFF